MLVGKGGLSSFWAECASIQGPLNPPCIQLRSPEACTHQEEQVCLAIPTTLGDRRLQSDGLFPYLSLQRKALTPGFRTPLMKTSFLRPYSELGVLMPAVLPMSALWLGLLSGCGGSGSALIYKARTGRGRNYASFSSLNSGKLWGRCPSPKGSAICFSSG